MTPDELTDGEKDVLADLNARPNYRDLIAVVAKIKAEAATAARADAWDEGYAFWYDNDRRPEHRDYGKGNPYRSETPQTFRPRDTHHWSCVYPCECARPCCSTEVL